MATTLDDLKVTLSLDSTSFVISASQAGKVIRSLSSQMSALGNGVNSIDRSLNSAAANFRKFVITLGALRFIMMDIQDVFVSLPAAILKSAGEIERMTKLMEGLSTETQDATRKLDAIKQTKFVFDMAMKSPLEVKALQDAFVKMKTAGLDPTLGPLQALVDGVAKFGGSSEQLKRSSIAIQQMAGKGVISMEELRQQLGEAMPTAMRNMAEGMKLTMAELTKQISKGTVEANSALSKMFAVMGRENAGAAAEMMTTWVGMSEQLKTRWELLKNEIANQGFLDAAKEGLKEINALFDNKEVRVQIIQLGSALADITRALSSMVVWAAKNIDVMKALGAALLTLIVAPKIIGGLNGIFQTISANARGSLLLTERAQRSEAALEATRLRSMEAQARAQATNAAGRLAAADGVMRQIEADTVRHYARLTVIDSQYLIAKNGRWKAAQTGQFISNAARDALVAEQNALRANILTNTAAIGSNVALANVSRKTEVAALATAAAHHTAARAVADVGYKFTATTAAMSTGRFILAAAGGWIGLITLALTAGAAAWSLWGNKGEDAIKQVMDAAKAGLANFDDQQKLQAAVEAQEKRVQAAQTSIDEVMDASRVGYNANNVNLLGPYYAALEKEVAALKELQRQIPIVAQQAVANQAKGIESTLDREAADAIGAILRKNSAAVADLRNNVKDMKVGSTEYKKGMEDIAAQLRQGDVLIINYLEERLVQAKEALDKAKNSSGETDALTLVEVLKARVDEQKEKLKRVDASLAAPNVINKKTDEGDTRTPFQKFMARHLERLAEMRNDVELYAKEVVTIADIKEGAERVIDTMIERGAFKGKKAPPITPEQRLEMIGVMVDQQTVEIAKNGAKQLSDVLQSTSAEVEKAQEDWDAQSNVVGQQESITEKLFKKLAPFAQIIREQLQMTATEYDEFVRKISVNAVKADSLKFSLKLHEDTKALRAQNNMDVRAGAKETAEFEIAQRQAVADHQVQAFRKVATESQTHANEIRRIEEELAAWIVQRREKLRQDTRTPLEKMADEWIQLTERMDTATAGWVSGFVDMFVDGLEKGKFAFKDFAVSILKDITKLMMQKMVAQFVQAFVGGFSWGGDGNNALDQSAYGSTSMNAMGGIMSPDGKLPLNSYASGGIAKSPQLAVFGEGRQNEAYVPLPDGKRIPVALEDNQSTPEVTVNVINQTGTQADAKTNSRFDGKQMVLDIVLTAANQPGSFRDGMKGAMR